MTGGAQSGLGRRAVAVSHGCRPGATAAPQLFADGMDASTAVRVVTTVLTRRRAWYVRAVSEENRRIASEMIAAMGRSDDAVFDRLLAADVRQWIPDSSAAKLGVENPVAGVDAVKALYARGPARYERVRFDALFVVADAGGAAAITQTDSRLHDGREFSNRYALFFRIESGRIAEIWEHPDTALMFEFFSI